MIGDEAREQILAAEGRLPGGRRSPASAAARTRSASSYGFLDDADVRLVGVEAAGAASLGSGRTAVLHGARSSVLADEDGQIADAHSISAGLDYPGVGPEHAALRDSGRAEYLPCTDEEALAAFHRLGRDRGDHPGARELPRPRADARPRGRARRRLPLGPRRQGSRRGAETRMTKLVDLPGLRARDARARGGGGRRRRRHPRARDPVLGPARRGPDDPARVGACARARACAPRNASTASRRSARSYPCRSCR